MAEQCGKPNYDAELHDWRFASYDEDRWLEGKIFNDTATHGLHPFPDGRPVKTSVVTSVEGNIAVTRNTIYKLVGEELKA